MFLGNVISPIEQLKMAAVLERVEGGFGALDCDSALPRLSTPPPDQPHQNNPLLGLPIVAIETILNFLSYDEISLIRLVRGNKNKPRSKWQCGVWLI